MQPLEARIDELLTRLPTATDFGTLLASVDALTTVLWAMHPDRDEEYNNRAPTAGGKGYGSGLPLGGRDGVGRVERKQQEGGDEMVNGLPSSWDGDEAMVILPLNSLPRTCATRPLWLPLVASPRSDLDTGTSSRGLSARK